MRAKHFSFRVIQKIYSVTPLKILNAFFTLLRSSATDGGGSVALQCKEEKSEDFFLATKKFKLSGY